jgi:hypothetical protein
VVTLAVLELELEHKDLPAAPLEQVTQAVVVEEEEAQVVLVVLA